MLKQLVASGPVITNSYSPRRFAAHLSFGDQLLNKEKIVNSRGPGTKLYSDISEEALHQRTSLRLSDG